MMDDTLAVMSDRPAATLSLLPTAAVYALRQATGWCLSYCTVGH